MRGGPHRKSGASSFEGSPLSLKYYNSRGVCSNLSGHNLKCGSNNGTYVHSITIEKPVNQTTSVYESVSKRIQPYFKETSKIQDGGRSENLSEFIHCTAHA